MKTLQREKLKVVAAADPSEQGRYVLDEQAGFLMRIAMQRHTSIFTSRMIEGLTGSQRSPGFGLTSCIVFMAFSLVLRERLSSSMRGHAEYQSSLKI